MLGSDYYTAYHKYMGHRVLRNFEPRDPPRRLVSRETALAKADDSSRVEKPSHGGDGAPRRSGPMTSDRR